MANVLGELFGEIAESIRGKTGETGTMKPAEFPQKISTIETKPVVQSFEITENGTYTAPEGVDGYNPVTVNVEPVLQEKTITENGEYTPDEGFDGLGKVTVEVAGSGGGSLPAGVYWEQANSTVTVKSRYFVWNGVLYYLGYVNDTNGYLLYKIVDGEKISTGQYVLSGVLSAQFIDLNGILHIVDGGNTNKHYTFDGTNITTLSGLGFTPRANTCYAKNGELYAQNKKCLTYKWNSVDDTWDETTLTSYQVLTSNLTFVHDNDVYMVDSGYKLYKVVDGLHTALKTFEPDTTGLTKSLDEAVYDDGFLWLFLSTNGYSIFDIYKYDISNDVFSFVGRAPYVRAAYKSIFFFEGKLNIAGSGDAPYHYHYIMHEVTE